MWLSVHTPHVVLYYDWWSLARQFYSMSMFADEGGVTPLLSERLALQCLQIRNCLPYQTAV